ncbi:hypothetical protein [Roseivirga sp.]|uniref:hypothetical protein n=1 Tax=Roseivirga sp. TaxID=1964215 RepID=UPI002B269AA3|nr:hypothetical protein [Roseivirga sp.]
MKTILLALSVSLLFWSCGTKPTVAYPTDDNGQVGEQALIVDSTLVLTGDLPVYFDSTDYLLFPIGEIQVSSNAGSKLYLGSGSSRDFSFSTGYLSGSSYTGSLSKIMIQHLDSSNFRPITEQQLKIRSFQFLESIHKKTGQQLVVMTVTDRDTNNDGKLTNDDIESLYISHLSGQNFKKLTLELQELLDWRILIVNKRLYFRTLEDIDKNGEFDKKDKIHHFFIDLTHPDFKVFEYNPLG